MTNARTNASTSLFAVGLTAGLMALSPVAALAQEETSSVANFTDWSVFNPKDPQECFIASQPTSSEARRAGKSVVVRRGEITLYVSTRPAEKVVNEVSFSAGYPFNANEDVKVKIGNETFEFYVEGEVAFPDSPEEDKKVIAAMKKGSSALITGLSRRGTTTVDTFSLLGFTDALADAEKRCN